LSTLGTRGSLLATLRSFGCCLRRRRVSAELFGRVERHLCGFRREFLLLSE
jgi:hypothetical protein